MNVRELICVIDEVTKYGLNPNVVEDQKELKLAKWLVHVYKLYHDVEDNVYDNIDYPDFDRDKLPDIKKNIESNFRKFGFYVSVSDINDFVSEQNFTAGYAVDDLLDITLELLEVKWRIENNSEADGLWFFKFITRAHTEHHIMGLLTYIKKNEEHWC